jgi:uncharacterized protein (DUF433 family)
MLEQLAEQRTHLAKTSGGSQFITVYISQDVYRSSEVLAKRESFTGLRLPEALVTVDPEAINDWISSIASVYVEAADFWRSRNWRINQTSTPATMFVVPHHGSHGVTSVGLGVPNHNRQLAARLSISHPLISTDENVLSGTPHIDGTRISVANVLAEVHHQGSIEAVSKKFSRIVNSEQIKAAIAYAHDFMEIACDLSEDDD